MWQVITPGTVRRAVGMPMTIRQAGGTIAGDAQLASLTLLTTNVATQLTSLIQQTQTADGGETAALAAVTDGLSSILDQLRGMQEDLTARGDDLATTLSALERAHQRYRDLFELAPDPYLVTDADSRILEANHAAIRLIGYSRAYTYGRSLLSFVAPDSALIVSARLRTMDEARADYLAEWELRLRTRGRAQPRVMRARVRRATDRAGSARSFLWLLHHAAHEIQPPAPELTELTMRDGVPAETARRVDWPRPIRPPPDSADDTGGHLARDFDDRRRPEPVEHGAGRRVSRRERDVLELLEQGLTNRQISERLVLSERTVEHHISRMLARFRLSTRTHLIAYALKHHLTGVSSGEGG